MTLDFKQCPIEVTMDQLGGKWTMPIIRDLHMGKTRFKEFLSTNPDLSAKVLSTRLKELQRHGVAEKMVASTTPLLIEYRLTEKGKALGDVLFSLAAYSVHFHEDEVYKRLPADKERDLARLKEMFSPI
jgi:DNA-binding HxlR family transcriptional regulator